MRSASTLTIGLVSAGRTDARCRPVRNDRLSIKSVCLQRHGVYPATGGRQHNQMHRQRYGGCTAKSGSVGCPLSEGRRSADGRLGHRVSIDINMPPAIPRTGPADVVVAAVEEGVTTAVTSGRNRGCTLARAVVRRMQTIGEVESAQQTGSFSWSATSRDEWRQEHLRVVAFVHNRVGRKVLAAASAVVTRYPPTLETKGNARLKRRST